MNGEAARRLADTPPHEEGGSRELDDVLAIVAHELRNPLHSIGLQMALAKATAESHGAEQVVARLAKVQAALGRYAQRVTMLLELASLNAGGLQVVKRHVNVTDTVKAIVDTATPEAASRGIALHVRAPEQCVAWTDPVMVEQIIDNLMLNAFKHAQATSVTIELACDKRQVMIKVIDDGRGISAADQERIFLKFSVAQHSRRGEGTGLGLWIVRRLLDALGGSIGLASTPGSGTTFTVQLPAIGVEEIS